MTTFRSDTSFPFLALARRLDMDYGHLLRTVEALKREPIGTIEFLCLQSRTVAAIVMVMNAEDRRRADVLLDHWSEIDDV